MKAPNFSLQDQDGIYRSLANYTGKWIVLYFYFQDETSGCTVEACNFRDIYTAISRLNDERSEIVGVSPDSVVSHKDFAAHHQLSFTLLSDPDLAIWEAFGAREDGKSHRNTYIINPEGEIVKTYTDVDPATHAAQITADLRILQDKALS